MKEVKRPSDAALAEAHCLEKVDHVPGDPATSAFKATARLHQALWRKDRGLPIGSKPIGGGTNAHPLGSNLRLDYAKATGENFLDPRVLAAVERRLAHAQAHQMLDVDRLYASLLSSMPMCFNLFGSLTPAQATEALRLWWPDTPGHVTEIIFEWSPGRAMPEYLGNRSAFDVAFVLELEDGGQGVVGIETKYHEHPIPVPIKQERLDRYMQVTDRSGAFKAESVETMSVDERSQIWLDHLLALSMLQHPSKKWRWARFALVYPDANPSWERLVEHYCSSLAAPKTFAALTFDAIVDAGILDDEVSTNLRDRYRCWSSA